MTFDFDICPQEFWLRRFDWQEFTYDRFLKYDGTIFLYFWPDELTLMYERKRHNTLFLQLNIWLLKRMSERIDESLEKLYPNISKKMAKNPNYKDILLGTEKKVTRASVNMNNEASGVTPTLNNMTVLDFGDGASASTPKRKNSNEAQGPHITRMKIQSDASTSQETEPSVENTDKNYKEVSCIFHKDDPIRMLSSLEVDSIKTALNRLILREIDTEEETQLQILSTVNRRTFLEIHPANKETFRWLAESFPQLELELPFEIKIKKQEDESNKVKITVKVEKEAVAPGIFLRRLSRFNPGLNVVKWKYLASVPVKNRPSDMLVILLADRKSFEFLKKNEMKLFYGTGQVIVKSESVESGQNANQDGVTLMGNW